MIPPIQPLLLSIQLNKNRVYRYLSVLCIYAVVDPLG
jgi:hypothetical protein